MEQLADGTQGYDGVCRNFKSIRQDCKVQNVPDANFIDVYKIQSRIALLKDDLDGYNTCPAPFHYQCKKVPGCEDHVR